MRPAEHLEGITLDEGWTVQKMVTPAPHATGGHFSVGYLVKNKNGKHAFLKALDFSRAFQVPDFSRELQSMTEAYNFERDLLNKCKNRRLNRVVTPISDGTVTVPGNFGDLSRVCYIIFEHAKGDIRDKISQFNEFDLAWCLRSLHNTAVGLSQLHSSGIAHQDLKPSNILIFPEEGSKIADLGRASDLSKASAIDGCIRPGDIGYAPPEQFYKLSSNRDFSNRFLADIYLLGSLFFFYFSDCSATQALFAKVKGFDKVNMNNSSFESDLPYLREAFANILVDLQTQVLPIAGKLTPQIIDLVRQLCEPNPAQRGDRLDSSRKHNMERFISSLNLLSSKAENKFL